MNKELTPLEALKIIENATTIYVGCASDIYTRHSLECKIIETALKRLKTLEEEKQSFDRQLEKKIKALEIIKEKKVNVNLVFCFQDVEKYNKHIFETVYRWENRQLTKQEYDILKEVLL